MAQSTTACCAITLCTPRLLGEHPCTSRSAAAQIDRCLSITFQAIAYLPPTIFSLTWKAIHPFMDAATKEKVSSKTSICRYLQEHDKFLHHLL